MLIAGTLTEFLKFLQIFFWITVPLLVASAIITTLVHYKRKSRKRAEELLAENLLSSLPDSEPDISDDITVRASIDQLKDFRNKLYFSNARYSVLKKDLNRLEEKYNDLLSVQHTSKTNTVEYKSEDVQRELQFQMERLKENYETEKEDLLGHLHILNNRSQALEEENVLLKEKIDAGNENGDHSFVTSLQIERTQLRKKVAELQYLEDLVDEKQLQINFLQQQLDQRIKHNHQIEQRINEVSTENADLKKKMDEATSRIMNIEEEMHERDMQDRELQELFEQKNATIGMLTEDVRRKSDRLNYLEDTIHEAKTRNESLFVTINQKESLVNELRLQLASVEERLMKLSLKFDNNRKQMAKMHDEMSSFISDENRGSPVIVMNTDYLLAEKETEPVASSQGL